TSGARGQPAQRQRGVENQLRKLDQSSHVSPPFHAPDHRVVVPRRYVHPWFANNLGRGRGGGRASTNTRARSVFAAFASALFLGRVPYGSTTLLPLRASQAEPFRSPPPP